MRPDKAFYPARDLLLSSGPRPFLIDRYAAINRRNDSHLIFWSSPSIRPKIVLHFWRKPFFFSFLILAINSAKKRFEFLAKIFLFWSAAMVAARWNLVRTECGPLLQKITDPCSRVTSFDGWQAFANCVRTSKFNIFDNQALLNSKISSLLCLLMYYIIKKKKLKN